ncbi:DNA methyltransferase [Paracoccus spongiarum]|uniref:Methyltransferase n=1 Tax=Paracoccus spongiarum TaxID=3064387 RepID=A0ABT9JFL7_9RHOB|nr:DNA methyltransferase [Paracoccus sp. 2205BS29-5]MDP5308607.1 DNA methyltransferase [Paracoccus sp. 2205BS29-5]
MNQLSLFPLADRSSSTEDFVEEISNFADFGKETSIEDIDGIRYFVNEFWTAGQRQAHSIHEVSYRACFKAQLPEFFISRLTNPGDVVFDPFMGRGTTPVQAALMGRQSFGNDINPLSTLLTRPRLRPISLQAVAAALKTVDWSRGAIQREDLLAFYHPATLRNLEALRLWLAERAPLGAEQVDPVADWIRMVAINRLSGHSPGFFSGRSMPPNQAVSVKAQLKINEKLGVSPPERDVAAVIMKKSKTLLKDGCAPSQVRSSLHIGAAWDVAGIPDATVDLTVTSPPFLDIVHYAADNWLRCWFAGIDPETVAIDMHRTEDAWTAMVHRVLAEQARMLRPGGYVAFEVGEVRNGKVLLERLVWKAAEELPFRRIGVMVNDQEFTKTANCWGVSNGAQGTNTNRIVLLQRL